MAASHPHVCVLGAGLQGSLIALALAERGASVTLVEQADLPMTAASLINEGKIHLGYVYAKDAADRTALLMARGAGCFAGVLGRYADLSGLSGALSAPFTYLVMEDSLLPPDALAGQYAKMDQQIARHCGDYLGVGAPAPARRVAWNAPGVAAAFSTHERSVDPAFLARRIRASLSVHPRIEFLNRTCVTRLIRGSAGAPDVETDRFGRLGPFDHLVNATWSDRLRLDACLGLTPDRPWLFRRKIGHFVTATRALPDIATVTLVLGAYGDVVSFDAGRRFFVSWYPTGCIARSDAIAPGSDWRRGIAPETGAASFRSALDHLGPVVAGVDRLADRVGHRHSEAGVIFSWGAGEVDRQRTELHQRFDVGPVTHFGCYHTVDTGKLTLAPLFAELTADRICPQ